MTNQLLSDRQGEEGRKSAEARLLMMQTQCQYAADCPNPADGVCQQKYMGFQLGCGIKICHEHSRLTLNSMSDYRRFVVGAVCIDCYPQTQRTQKRGKFACYFVIIALIIFVGVLIICDKVQNGKEESASPEVYDPVEEESQ